MKVTATMECCTPFSFARFPREAASHPDDNSMPFLIWFVTRYTATGRAAFNLAAPSARYSWTASSCCMEHCNTALQVPPFASTELFQEESTASLAMFQHESVAATPPATQAMTSVTAAVEALEGGTPGRLGFRQCQHQHFFIMA
ncbi:hypothetical protein MTO96_016139 [Rhipicephalus appendiculatus]